MCLCLFVCLFVACVYCLFHLTVESKQLNSSLFFLQMEALHTKTQKDLAAAQQEKREVSVNNDKDDQIRRCCSALSVATHVLKLASLKMKHHK